MDGTIKLPVFGTVKKGTAAVGGAAIAGIFLFLWWRQHKTDQAAQAAGSATTPQTAAPQGIDPGFFAAGDGGAGIGNLGDGGGGPQGPGNFRTNADWAQYAEEHLTGLGNHAQVVGNALGKYLTGQPLTPDQVSIVQEAIAFAGYPPLSGPDGHPPGYLTATPPHKPPGGKVRVPGVLGRNSRTAERIIRQAGLVPRAPAGHRASWIVGHQDPAPGTRVSKGSTVVIEPPAWHK